MVVGLVKRNNDKNDASHRQSVRDEVKKSQRTDGQTVVTATDQSALRLDSSRHEVRRRS